MKHGFLIALLAVSLPLAAEISPLVFTPENVSAPVVPGGASFWFAVTADTRRSLIRSDRLVDTDRDGWTHWTLTQPLHSRDFQRNIWTVVDMTSGRLMAGQVEGTVPRHSAFPSKMFFRDAAGNFSTLAIDMRGLPAELQLWHFLWVRPGVSAWYLDTADGASEDLDHWQNSLLIVRTASFQPAEDVPTPAGFQPGDLLIGIDAAGYSWFGDKVDDHLNEASGPGVLSQHVRSAYEEKGGVARVTLVRRDGADGVVSVRYATQDDTAVAGVHYQSVAGTLELGPGELVKTFEIPILDDLTYSGNSQFKILFTDPAGATMPGATSATIHILEDDPKPTITLSGETTVQEGGDGAQEVTVYARLNGATRLPATVNWWVLPTAGAITTGGALTFAPGETQKAIVFSYAGNTVAGKDRLYEIAFNGAQHANTTGHAVVRVIDDDLPALSVSNREVVEFATSIEVYVAPDVAGKPMTFHYATVDGTAKAGSDYQAVSGTATITASQQGFSIRIPILDDIVIEPQESFEVVISNASGATIARSRAIVSIVDTDATPRQLAVESWTGPEKKDATFTFRIGSPSPKDISVVATTRSAAAVQGADFVAATTTVRIPAGQTTVTWTVDVIDDAVDEPNELFFVDLTQPVNATLYEGYAVGVIVNDDAPRQGRRRSVRH